MNLFTWVLNKDVISHFTVVSPLARDVWYFLGSVGLSILIAYVARKRTQLLDERALGIGAVACGLAGTAGFYVAVGLGWEVLAGFAFFVCTAASLLATVFFFVSLCEMEDMKRIAICICFSYAAAALVQVLLNEVPPEARLLVFSCLPAAIVVLCRPEVQENLRRLHEADRIDDYALSSPRSFLSPFNLLFVSFFVFQFVFGFGLALNCVSGVPVDTSLVGIAAVILGVCILVSRKDRGSEDILFQIASLLVVGGFLLAILALFMHVGIAANIVLSAGSLCMTLLRYLTISAIGSRNKLDAVYVIGISRAFSSSGVLIGAAMGHSANSLEAASEPTAALVLAGILFAFMFYCLIPMRHFSFEATIYGVKTVEPIVVQPEEDTGRSAYEQCCTEIGTEYGLTNREQEILSMLARGRNGKFIEDFYTISYNTVKTHVKHIYMKLDVHSQQELIDLVEDAIESKTD